MDRGQEGKEESHARATLYDGDGRRVYKSSGKLYWYGAGDEILAETDGSGNTTAEYTFFGGKRIAMLPAGGSAQYYVEDFLGSSRVVTQSNGVVCYDSDFTPFGGELPYTNTCPAQNNYKFEGKERDTETGNDDFGARSYSWRFGRWLSADWSAVPVAVPYANLTNPQTLNLYAMVSDDPESFADLDGHQDPAPGHPGLSDIPTTMNPADAQKAQQQWSLSWQVSASANFLVGELKGVADVTVTPIVQAVEHPVDTAEGIANAVAHPVQTAENAANGAVSAVKAAASGDPRAIGQVVGVAATVAYAAGNVRPQLYENAGGGGVNILNTPTTGSRIGLDIHGIPEAGGGVRPHIDITIKRPGVPSGPGSNLVNIKHWPW